MLRVLTLSTLYPDAGRATFGGFVEREAPGPARAGRGGVAPRRRVLTLSALDPDAGRPTLGVCVERQTQALARREGVEVQVASGAGLPPWPLSLHPHYRALRGLESGEHEGLLVNRVPFPTLPRLPAGAGKAPARAVAPAPAARP